MKPENNIPWQNPDGSPKEDRELQVDCKSWDATTWESYLKTQEGDQVELLFENPISSENFSQEDHNKFKALQASGENHPELKNKLLDLMKSLSKKQQLVLHCVYWDNLTLVEVAKKVGITRQSVYDLKSRALKKLGQLLIDAVIPIHRPADKKVSSKWSALSAPTDKTDEITIGREASHEK